MHQLEESAIPAQARVLLVDDDPSMLRILSAWLTQAGFAVTCAEDGQQALDSVEADPPDFLITDWEMPRINGLELCRRVRRQNLPHYVYILFLTVRSAPDEMIEGLEMGADDFLTKPIYQGELLARMRSGARVLDLERRLSQSARTDPLTGLMTRHSFYESLEKEWQRSRRYHLPLSCVMIGVDFLKHINDEHGHSAGDSVLKAVAELLGDCCRASDSLCRCGGGEFCAMLPETDQRQAAEWAQRVRERLAVLEVPFAKRSVRVTASFGAAENLDDVRGCEELADLANQALLCAKQLGRDRIVCYQSLQRGRKPAGPDACDELFRGATAGGVMDPLTVCLREQETVARAAELLLDSQIDSTAVVDAEGRLSGMLCEKDLMAAMISPDRRQGPVAEVMRHPVIRYEEDTPVGIIYEFLCRVSIGRVVIVTQGRPVGTISRGMLLRWFSNQSEPGKKVGGDSRL